MAVALATPDRLDAARPVSVSDEEYRARRTRLSTALDQHGCDIFLGLSGASIQYLTGYAVTPTERPFALLLDHHGEVTLIVPLLKERDVRDSARADAVLAYSEYPDRIHPMQRISDAVRATVSGRVLLERARHESPYGYEGPSLLELLPQAALDRTIVERLRMVKSAVEIGLLRHAADWACFAQGLLQEATAPSLPESQVAGQATGAAMRRLRELHGRRADINRPMSVSAGFGGQVGINGTAHHLQRVLDPLIQRGDPLITRVQSFVGGYYADIERTMIVDAPNKQLRDLFERGLAIQSFTLGLIGPGRSASEIDSAVRHRYEQLGLAAEWRHHVGHSVGLLPREAPYLDIGSSVVLEPGMVVTVEPGLYRDGVGGFRHSDCVLITETGCEVLTPYPRDLEALCC